MNRDQFVKELRRVARRRGVAFSTDSTRGKGSHIMLIYGDKKTSCPQGELKEGTRRAILEQLGIE